MSSTRLSSYDGNTDAGATAQSGIQAAVTRLRGAVKTAQLSAQAIADQAGFPDEAARRKFLEETLDRAVKAWEEPPLTVVVTRSGVIVEDDEEITAMPSGYAQSSPGNMVTFARAGLVGSAEIIVMERKFRTLQRLLTTAIPRVEVILGHLIGMFVLIFLQFVLLIGLGQVALGLDYLREPLAVLLMMVTIALWIASMGLLIGVLARTSEQVAMLAVVPMLVLAGLGGAWILLEVTRETFQTIGRLTPTAWAMDGLQNIIVRGLGLNSVLLPAGILLAYAVLFFALAVWGFRFE